MNELKRQVEECKALTAKLLALVMELKRAMEKKPLPPVVHDVTDLDYCQTCESVCCQLNDQA